MKNLRRGLWLVLVLSLLLSVSHTAFAGGAIKEGKKVKIQYSLSVDGEVKDSSAERGPYEFIYGQGALMPTIEAKLKGMKEGDKETFTLTPDQAFGQPDPTAILEVPKSQVPEKDVQVGMVFSVTGPDGNAVPAIVKEIRDDSIVLDFNHPLAGKTVEFTVEVLEVS